MGRGMTQCPGQPLAFTPKICHHPGRRVWAAASPPPPQVRDPDTEPHSEGAYSSDADWLMAQPAFQGAQGALVSREATREDSPA